MTSERKNSKMELLADVVMAWRHGTLNNRHSRAVEDLEATSSELRMARLQVMRSTQRFEKLERKLLQIDIMQDGLFMGYVLSSWGYAVQIGRLQRMVNMQGKGERVSMAMKLTSQMQRMQLSKMMPAIIGAWRMRTKNQNQATKHLGILSHSFTEAALAAAFHEWKHLVLGVHQGQTDRRLAEVTETLVRKDEELVRMQRITEELYGFSKESDIRVRELESALQAADKAIEAGAAHGSLLEKEVSSLETQLRALESRVRRGEEAERELKIERDVTSVIKVELATTKGEREAVANKAGIPE